MNVTTAMKCLRQEKRSMAPFVSHDGRHTTVCTRQGSRSPDEYIVSHTWAIIRTVPRNSSDTSTYGCSEPTETGTVRTYPVPSTPPKRIGWEGMGWTDGYQRHPALNPPLPASPVNVTPDFFFSLAHYLRAGHRYFLPARNNHGQPGAWGSLV